tara:strand:- start:92 stop:697 length:606 start_codon:yes stop_codon:yes gene_type:complete
MVIHPLKKISVDYDVPVEEFSKLSIGIPESYVASRKDFYNCTTCRKQSDYYNNNWDCVRYGHSIQKSSRPQFMEKIEGPFELNLGEGINSDNFPSPRKGVMDFEASLFEKHPGVGYPREGQQLLDAIEIDGYEPADIWQLVNYFQTYPKNHIFDIAATAEKPVAICFDTYSHFHGVKGLSLKLLDSPSYPEYVSLALGIKK